MLKKITAVAAMSIALLFGGTVTADAQSGSDNQQPAYKVFYQVQSYGGAFNQEDLQSFLKDTLKQYNIDWNQLVPVQPKEQPKQEQPKQEQPKQEQPAEPKQEAPAKEEPAKQPEQAPAPQPKETPAQPAEQQTQQAPAEKQAAEQNQNSELNEFEQKVVELTNQERQERGLAPLKVDTELSKVAREKSADMASNGYFSHTSPTYGSPFDMMKQFGIEYRTAGENIAKGQRSPQEVVNAWMNSEGHRKNILNSSFTHIGVGYVENGNVWTQMFIGK
ncbi:CAP domain-containing protein [Thalassobacillus pellis]|uniref:CAP domain-containing protein n=1 Tax=Thalassobacillus pellis TaxID=748008 RepID=UPI00195FF21A|nr:CAP domain-containing protein [Thalassobacillus pellis]MBM7553681.1 putative YkwD family protein [Thalassobacillus pellis]